MRKILFALTTAVALGALAVPMSASAKNSNGGSGGRSAGNTSAGSFHASNFNGNGNMRSNRRIETNNAVVNGNRRAWSGQQWAWKDHDHDNHHRHHRGDFVFFAPYGDYATYDTCWQTIWTPAGYQTVYVCGPDYYSY